MNKQTETSPAYPRGTLHASRFTKKGFTLIELMISITILGLIMTIASSIYANFFGSMRNLKAANTVYEETRFLMERIVKEVRNGTVDYEEYYNQSQRKDLLGSSYDIARNETYAQEYCKYSLEFYNVGNDGDIGTYDDEATGVRNPDSIPAIGDSIQNQLFLINSNGDKRTYIKRVEETVGDRKIGKIVMLKLLGEDFGVDHIDSTDTVNNTGCNADVGENDGRIDTWVCEKGFNCSPITVTTPDSCIGNAGETIVSDPKKPEESSFVDITPAALDIKDIKFIVSPMDDPRKAFNTDEVQIQPSVTIKIIARANPAIAAQFKSGEVPDMILESTVSARAMNEITTECNLKQCIYNLSPPKPCPLSAGVCGPNPVTNPEGDPAMQECSTDFLWSGCNKDENYIPYAENEYPEATEIQGDGNLYQSGSEFSSCKVEDISGCKTAFCTDEYDNDCDGFTDETDPDCLFHLCNNGTKEDFEQCIDVGDSCQQLRPYEEKVEVTCEDGYDNDCDGYADEFDPDCIIAFCQDKLQTPPPPEQPSDPLIERFLSLDIAVIPVVQRNYLRDKTDYDTDINEQCIDVGGICDLCYTIDGKTSCVCGTEGCTKKDDTGEKSGKIVKNSSSAEEGTGETKEMCTDGLDNDCDGRADELDDGCISSHYCTNSALDCALAPPTYTPAGYLLGYSDSGCKEDTDNDEMCADVGGLCDGFREIIGETVKTYVDHAYLTGGEATPVTRSAPPDTDTCKEGAGNCPQTTAVHTCTDGLDNDCDEGKPGGGIDWEDPDCCPDADGDGSPGDSETCRHEKDGGVVPDIELLDCNDNDANINPDVVERCDGPGFDYDCDGLTSENDPGGENDSGCCTDKDVDGYGIAAAYIACPDHKDKPDCNDFNAAIHPALTESNCSNEENGYPVNDNCDSSADNRPQANHIDWYADKDNAWFINYGEEAGFDTSGLTVGGIAAAYKLGLFDPTCCDSGATEFCDDPTNSDENCNGLEGEDDYVCINKDGSRFFDNFTSGSYIATAEDGAYRDGASGNITLASASDVGKVTSYTLTPFYTSLCSGDFKLLFYPLPVTDLPAGTSIRFQIRADNGATWCGNDDCDGDDGDWFTIGEITGAPPAYAEFPADSPDNSVQWRAELEGDGGSKVPVLDKLSISIQCL